MHCLNVAFHFAIWCKGWITIWAGKWLLLFMNWFNMSIQIMFQWKIFIARITFEWLLFLMNWINMMLEVLFLWKSGVTLYTSKWFFSFMNCHFAKDWSVRASIFDLALFRHIICGFFLSLCRYVMSLNVMALFTYYCSIAYLLYDLSREQTRILDWPRIFCMSFAHYMLTLEFLDFQVIY